MTTPEVSREAILGALRWRYATKAFDSERKIPEADWQMLEEALVLTPSSFGLQPWKFVVVTEAEVKEKLLAVSWKQQQVAQCSHLLVITAHRTFSEGDVDRFLDRTSEIQGSPRANLEGLGQVVKNFVGQAQSGGWLSAWTDRQCYLALEQFLFAAALRGIDTCPMEGLDPLGYDRILGLEGSGYATVVACAAGYRATDDRAAARAKVRYEAKDLFLRL